MISVVQKPLGKIDPCPKCGGKDFTIEEDFLEYGKKIICDKCKDERKVEVK